MKRLWTLPDGSVTTQVFVSEHPDNVARASVKLAETLPGATFEDYSNDDYDVLLATHGGDLTRWHKEGATITVRPASPSARETARAEMASATTIAQLKAALGKLL